VLLAHAVLELSRADLSRLDAAVPPGAAAGERYMPWARPRWE